MKKIFLALLLVAASGVPGYSRDVRVLLKSGGERKGELALTSEGSVSLKFKNGQTQKLNFSDIDSVIDEATGKDILSSIEAEGKAAEGKAREVKKTPVSRKAADNFAVKSPRKALPDNVMGWMAERYDAKTMLGFNWEHPYKAKIHYAFEKGNSGPGAGFLAPSGAGRTHSGRLDFMPVSGFLDSKALDIKTNSYLELRYSKAGAGAAWNIGYIKYSETRHDDVLSFTGNDFITGDKYRKTDASVLYASLLLTLPVKNLSYYGYFGPAVVSYDYSETGAYSDYNFTTFTTTPGAFAAKKSATTATWIAGFGGALRLSDSGFGIFGEYKHLPASGSFAGADNLGAGLSFGF